MATTGTVKPTEEKTHCFRLLTLVVDGGTHVLRHQFHQAIPPEDLYNTLCDPQVRRKLNDLNRKNQITRDQFNLLYPQIGQPISAKFDISLLFCLLRYICGLNEQSQSWQGIPPSSDTSLESDIQRMRLIRNEMCHMTSLSLTEQNFSRKWNETEQVILRLGHGIPTLKQDIQKLKDCSIDPEKEKYYQEKLKGWEETDTMKSKLADIESNVKDFGKKLEQLEITNVSSQELESRQSKLEQVVLGDRAKIDEKHKRVSERLSETELKAKQIEETVAQLSGKAGDGLLKISPELESLCSTTRLYLEDADRDEIYVETSVHLRAKETLETTNCLILTGLPGEGKTTMATKLISEVTDVDSVLKLREPSDWKLVDLSSNRFNTIFIDDIFGAGSFDEKLHRGWSTYLPEIEKAVKKNQLKVIITTRHYIFEEAREKMRRMHLFKDKNVISLDSAKLTVPERTQMLENHLKHADKEFASAFIEECNTTYEYSFSNNSYNYLPRNLPDTSTYIWGGKRIGFPEIVDIFVNSEQLYKQGASFFEKPVAFFRTCMEDLFLDEEKYLALILLWSRPLKELKVEELCPSPIQSDIETTIQKFNFELKGPLLKVLRKSLQHHKGGYLRFNPRTGTYSFCHNIVKDMVGLVAGQEYPEAVLELADKEFIMQYVTTDKGKDDGFHLYIEEYMFEQLRQVICRTLLFNPSQRRSTDYLFGLHNQFHLKTIGLEFEDIHLNASSLAHDCFCNRSFIASFYKSKVGQDLLSKPVATLSREFSKRYGLRLPVKKCMVYLPTLALLFRNIELLEEFLKYNFDPKSGMSAQFLEMSLLIAVHAGIKSQTLMMLEYGAISNENVILVAASQSNVEILDILLVNRPVDYDTQSYIINSNSPLIAAAKHGIIPSVECLIKHKVNVNYRNRNNMSALDKAVIYRQYEVCRILLENGAEVNSSGVKYKRTPLHMAADVNGSDRHALVEIAKLLIRYGASLHMKDYRGHWPIHCAAIRCNNDVLKTLLEEDVSQASVRVTSYGKHSFIKGMDLFHIAVWKNNPDLIDILLQYNADPNMPDFYGRTPFYCAVYNGNLEISKKLLNVADIRQAEKTGFTPLHAAVRNGNSKLAKMICPAADINAKDKYGKTPLHIACETKNVKLFRILVTDYKADVRMLTNEGETIFRILKNPSTQTQKRKMMKNNVKGSLSAAMFEKCIQIVESVDVEFAHNWEVLSSSSLPYKTDSSG
ncbi:uncharacterized protein LOC123527465 [Mercenaria mercenaria]|uniref:uncharacterized protein LOC123527465 n=1 Tax=Mercenaria mercenaria TaxID=6596 RepID=UPI00234E6171|nr:uncharacterized protein LOC123527465 [Mercenaria mercenaria]XP_053375861.1 uncharacterized protein LOC123527465 [Mercenaria mercenaria]